MRIGRHSSIGLRIVDDHGFFDFGVYFARPDFWQRDGGASRASLQLQALANRCIRWIQPQRLTNTVHTPTASKAVLRARSSLLKQHDATHDIP